MVDQKNPPEKDETFGIAKLNITGATVEQANDEIEEKMKQLNVIDSDSNGETEEEDEDDEDEGEVEESGEEDYDDEDEGEDGLIERGPTRYRDEKKNNVYTPYNYYSVSGLCCFCLNK